MQSITNTARQISATDLSQRIELHGSRDELFILGETFNQMLDRLEQGFKSQPGQGSQFNMVLPLYQSITDLL